MSGKLWLGIAVLIACFGFVFVYYLDSQNGRYQKVGSVSDYAVLDTRTGTFYAMSGEKWAVVEVVSGNHSIKEIDTE